MRRGEHLRAQLQKNQVQAMRRGQHLRTQPRKKQVKAMRRGEHLREQPHKKQVQAMRLGEHLRAQPPKKRVQGLPAEGGLGRLPAEADLLSFSFSGRGETCGHARKGGRAGGEEERKEGERGGVQRRCGGWKKWTCLID
jgi:hypothetical protein